MDHVYYIHGFGGRDSAPGFMRRMADYFKKHRLRVELSAFAWDSQPVDLRRVVHHFFAAREEAGRAGQRLLARLQEHEAREEPCHLVGFSLGAEVIRSCLAATEEPLRCLRGIYLVGAAIAHDTDLNEIVIPAEARCHNYHSPGIDLALGFSFANAIGKPAAGAEGLTRSERFENLRVRCTHAALYNYGGIAPAVAALIAWDAGEHVPGKPSPNIEAATAGGDVHWHQICHHNGCRIQMNMHSGHYRALDARGVRKAWGTNLHAVLRASGGRELTQSL